MAINSMSVVVTGAAGFIGGAIADELIKQGRKVIVVDDKKSRHVLNYGCTYVHKDDFLEALPYIETQAVIHQGACSDTMNHDRPYMMQCNYEYTVRLYEICNKLKVPLIYASSAAVYGMGTQGFSESTSLASPLNVYGESKLLVDEYIASQTSHAQVVGLRYFNVYGSDESHKGRMASVMFHFHKQVQNHNHVQPFEGSEKFYRDFVYIDDVVAINLFFLKQHNISGVFNVGTGKERNYLDVARTIQDITDCDIHYQQFPEALEGKYQEYTCADISKLRRVGYHKEFFTLEEGIKDYWSKLS